MSLVVEQLYPAGVPQTAVYGFSPPGVGWHWTAGGAGRVGWNGSVAHLINTRGTVNASYHAGFWAEHVAGHVVCKTIVQWIVPTTKAAHSVAPSQCWQYNAAKDRTRQDVRFAEVRRILGAKAGDPNAAMIAIAYAGMPEGLQQDLECPVFRADVKDMADQLVEHPATDARPHFGHGWIQPISRYEMDVTTDFIAMLYEQAEQPVEEEMLFWRPVQQDWNTFAGTVFYDGAGVKKVFTAPERVRSFAEDSTGRWRLVQYGTETLLVDARGSQKEGPGLSPIANTRVPATGFGYPPAQAVEVVTEIVKEVPTGITEEQLSAKYDEGVLDEKARVRKFLGLT